MRLAIVSRDREFGEVARWEFRTHPEVEVIHGRFEDVPEFDCVVTAGNSFGLMDAGMDLAVVKFFGTHVMESIQQLILQEHLGEQPVGTCLIVATGHLRHPFVAHAPTMRAPMNVMGTDNVYLAMWASLCAVHRHNQKESRKIEKLICPGLGTGTGGMDLIEAALQMRLAYEHFKNPPQRITPGLAQSRHERIHFGGRWGFTHPRPPSS